MLQLLTADDLFRHTALRNERIAAMNRRTATLIRIVSCILSVAAGSLILLSVTISYRPSVSQSYSGLDRPVEPAPIPTFAPDHFLNTADEAALDELPGIGEVIARNMVMTREAEGDFLIPEHLMTVDGIGPKRMEGIMSWLEAQEATPTDLDDTHDAEEGS